MRQPNSFLKLGFWRKAPWFFLCLGVGAVMFSVAMLSKFQSISSLVSAEAFCNNINVGQLNHAVVHKTIDAVFEKIEEEIEKIRSLAEEAGENDPSSKPEMLRYVSLLVDVMGLIEPLRTPLKDVNQTIHNVTIHHLIPIVTAPQLNGSNRSASGSDSDDLVEFFRVEEMRKYVKIKPNRLGKKNFMGANGTFTSIGHACFSMKKELEEYMTYDVGDFCEDDWMLAQKLMVHGCDPLPRRRCFSRAPKLYTSPFPINESNWKLPDDRNVRWSQYRCKNFACLANNSTNKGFFKCADCFNLTHHEMPRWMLPSPPDPLTNLTSDFLIEEVLNIKPGLIRIGLDFSTGTGTFAARMWEFNVTIVSATINLGAPFNEMVALRGFIPLYLTINQRLPFFDNTLDIIHTTRFLDGWIDLVLLDFVLYDWDRVLRPGGLLWIDSFFCLDKDLNDYLDAFKMLRYRKHKWVVVPKLDKNGEEFFFSAVLEKPPRPF